MAKGVQIITASGDQIDTEDFDNEAAVLAFVNGLGVRVEKITETGSRDIVWIPVQPCNISFVRMLKLDK